MRLALKASRRAGQFGWRHAARLRGAWLLWLNGARVGRGAQLVGPAFVEALGELVIGDRSRIVSGHWANPVGGSQRTSLVVKRGGRLEIGADVGASNVEIYCWTQVVVGDRTLIGGGTRIYDSDFHPLDPSDRSPDRPEKVRSKPIRIGSDVFVGGGSIILKGVTIGDGAVIGAGSVVTRDVPGREIWAGNPACFVKALASARPGAPATGSP